MNLLDFIKEKIKEREAQYSGNSGFDFSEQALLALEKQVEEYEELMIHAFATFPEEYFMRKYGGQELWSRVKKIIEEFDNERGQLWD